jgi:hypothetical protein
MNFRSLLGAGILLLASHAALAVPSLYFFIDGDTFTQPFSINNNSSSGERVTRFQLDLSPTGMVFDPVDLGPPGNGTLGTPFTPRNGSDALTGLVATTGPADGATLLDLLFNDFNVGETFSWDIDIDGATGSPISVFGNQLIGATAIIDFSDGQRLIGMLTEVIDNSDASEFTVTGRTTTPIPEPGSLALLLLGFAAIASRRMAKI